jgi:hypothetical protein
VQPLPERAGPVGELPVGELKEASLPVPVGGYLQTERRPSRQKAQVNTVLREARRAVLEFPHSDCQ